MKPGFAEAAALADAVADGAVDAVALAGGAADALGMLVVVGALEVAAFDVAGAAFDPRPKSCGARQMTMPRPMRLTSKSITENTASFCRVDGPRGRTTTVGVRGRRGRSGMRIVSAT